MRPSAVLFFVFFGVAALAAASLPAAANRHHHVAVKSHHHVNPYRVIRVAPADEYFGRMKMSILGIRNQLRDLSLRVRYAPSQGDAVLGSAAWVEDAMHDWEHKYPGDPWLPKSVYDLTRLYAGVRTSHGHSDALRCFHWLMARYGRTSYGTMARKYLQAQVGLR